MRYDRSHVNVLVDAGAQMVLLRAGSKLPAFKKHMTHWPTADECMRHVARGGRLGVRPASLGCVALDCDDGDGPHVAEEWAGRSHVCTTPSSSGKAHKGHVWASCPEAVLIRNANFVAGDETGLDEFCEGQLRTTVHVALTPEALATVADAFVLGHDADALDAESVTALCPSHRDVVVAAGDLTKAQTEGRDEIAITDALQRLLDDEGGDRSESFWQALGYMKKAGASLDCATETLTDTACAERFEEEGRLEQQCRHGWATFVGNEAADLHLDFADEPDLDAAGGLISPRERMNERYCAVNLQGKFRVAYQETEVDPEDERSRTSWQFSTRQAFEDLHMHRTFERPDGKLEPLGRAWLTWGGREQAGSGVTFDPSTDERKVGDRLNLWTGYGAPAIAGDWFWIRWMIEEALCGGDREASRYVLDWIAWTMQNPHLRPGVAVAFTGAKGTGKTTLGELVVSCLGSHGLVLSRREQLTGQFNAHLSTACFVLCDEVEFKHASGREDAALKKIVTDKTSMVERKGVDQARSTNRLSVMLASNSSSIVPATPGERRYFVVDVPDTWSTADNAPNIDEARRRWRDVHEQIRDGGVEAFLAAMLDRKLATDWSPMEAMPASEALVSQKVENLDLVERWFLDACQTGDLPQPLDEIGDGGVVACEADWGDWSEGDAWTTYAEVADDVMKFAAWEGVRTKRPSAKSLLKALRPFGVSPVKNFKQTRAWRLPSLDDARTAWKEVLGGDPFEAP